MFTVHLAKEPFKFSCSHFTIFAADHAERLHGHNYQLSLAIELTTLDSSLGMGFDFNQVKPMAREFCEGLDERILVQAKSPFLKIEQNGKQIEMKFADRYYSLPKEEVVLLPLANITVEELARYACEHLMKKMKDLAHWENLCITVEETRGQSVSYSQKR